MCTILALLRTLRTSKEAIVIDRTTNRITLPPSQARKHSGVGGADGVPQLGLEFRAHSGCRTGRIRATKVARLALRTYPVLGRIFHDGVSGIHRRSVSWK